MYAFPLLQVMYDRKPVTRVVVLIDYAARYTVTAHSFQLRELRKTCTQQGVRENSLMVSILVGETAEEYLA